MSESFWLPISEVLGLLWHDVTPLRVSTVGNHWEKLVYQKIVCKNVQCGWEKKTEYIVLQKDVKITGGKKPVLTYQFTKTFR